MMYFNGSVDKVYEPEIRQLLSYQDDTRISTDREALLLDSAKVYRIGEVERTMKLLSSDSFASQNRRSTKKPSESHTDLIWADKVLSPLEVTALTCVLEDCVDNLNILSYTNNVHVTVPNMVYRSLEQRLAAFDLENTVIDLETNQIKKYAIAESCFKKFQSDRGFSEKTFYLTLKDLKAIGAYETLASVVIQHCLETKEEEQFIKQYEEHKIKANRLKGEIKKLNKNIREKTNRKCEEIAQIKDKIQDIIFHSDLNLQYTDHWERARYEQNLYRLNKWGKELKNEIFQTKIKTEIESRVNRENETFIQESENRLEDDIMQWAERYEREVEDKDIEIQILKEKKAANLEELENLALLFEQHREELELWKAMKLAEEQAIELEQLRDRAATKIQAWWRGVMVRRQLGPYSKKKKKGKKGKKEKGGKGSKSPKKIKKTK